MDISLKDLFILTGIHQNKFMIHLSFYFQDIVKRSSMSFLQGSLRDIGKAFCRCQPTEDA